MLGFILGIGATLLVEAGILVRLYLQIRKEFR